MAWHTEIHVISGKASALKLLKDKLDSYQFASTEVVNFISEPAQYYLASSGSDFADKD